MEDILYKNWLIEWERKKNFSKIFLFGSLYKLNINYLRDLKIPRLIFIDNKFSLFLNDKSSLKENLYRKFFEYVSPKLLRITKTVSFENKLPLPNKISIKNQKTRWGSCSSLKNINLNWKLAFLPTDLCTYVIIHELCHLVHMNHSVKFWNCVEKYIPDYKLRIYRLRDIENLVMNII